MVVRKQRAESAVDRLGIKLILPRAPGGKNVPMRQIRLCHRWLSGPRRALITDDKGWSTLRERVLAVCDAEHDGGDGGGGESRSTTKPEVGQGGSY